MLREISDIVDQEHLVVVLDKIKGETGYDFCNYKKSSLSRRFLRRLNATDNKTYAEYSTYLDHNPTEYHYLLNDLTINVSAFFRDREAFQMLSLLVINPLLQRTQKSKKIRIWSVGCSYGEEPYSLAILMAEKLGSKLPDYDIKIFATDIDNQALACARQGSYQRKKLDDSLCYYLQKYFDDIGGQCVMVKNHIRDLVCFGKHNLVTDPAISNLDLIVCRNVLIYFESLLQDQVFSTFHSSLNSDGALFLGRSESLTTAYRSHFDIVDKKWKIYHRKANMPGYSRFYPGYAGLAHNAL